MLVWADTSFLMMLDEGTAFTPVPPETGVPESGSFVEGSIIFLVEGSLSVPPYGLMAPEPVVFVFVVVGVVVGVGGRCRVEGKTHCGKFGSSIVANSENVMR